MTNSLLQIKTIQELHTIFGYPNPNHPLISVVDLSQIALPDDSLGVKATASFYTIALKSASKQTFKYGKELFDFDNGCLYGISPHQVGEVMEVYKKGEMEGWALYFHPDLIQGYDLGNQIRNYNFFSYNTNEALHVSETEKEILINLINQIQNECISNIDTFSQDVLVASITLLLQYIKRYYNRQFITRKKTTSNLVHQFEEILNTLFIDNDSLDNIPTVKDFASQLNISPAYLADLLKKETGKSPLEHIHYTVLEKAKNLLMGSNLSVSEIAYKLGFEYPTYFTRLFKNKTGTAPLEYRNHLN